MYNIDADNKMHEDLRRQTDRIINTWNVIRSSKRCFEEYSDIGAQEAAAHIDRMKEARDTAQSYMEEIREEWLWMHVSRSRQRWATGAATSAEWRKKEKALVEAWELLAYNSGKTHDETAQDRRTVLEDKITGGNETVSWYDTSSTWAEGARGKLNHFPHRNELRRRWHSEHPEIPYSLMLAKLSTCMGSINRMEKCRDVLNTPLAVQGINDRMRDLLDDNLEDIVHKYGAHGHSPTDDSPVTYFHPAREMALRNASDQWGRAAGKATHTGRAISMPARNTSVSLECSLDEELAEVSINTMSIINDTLRGEHLNKMLSMVTTPASKQLKQAEHALELMDCPAEPSDQDQYECMLAAALIVIPTKRKGQEPAAELDPLFAPRRHLTGSWTLSQVEVHGGVGEDLTEDNHTWATPICISNSGYDIIQAVGKEEANNMVLVSAPTYGIHSPNGQRGIRVDFPDTPGGGPGRQCRNGYYTQAMQIDIVTNRHPYVEQWCDPTSHAYMGRQDYWTSTQSISNCSHRWLGSVWKQLEQIKVMGDETEKGITAMVVGSSYAPEMHCSSQLPMIAAGKEVVQREYKADFSCTPPRTTYRLRVIKLHRPWQSKDLQGEWRQVCDNMHAQEVKMRISSEHSDKAQVQPTDNSDKEGKGHTPTQTSTEHPEHTDAGMISVTLAGEGGTTTTTTTTEGTTEARAAVAATAIANMSTPAETQSGNQHDTEVRVLAGLLKNLSNKMEVDRWEKRQQLMAKATKTEQERTPKVASISTPAESQSEVTQDNDKETAKTSSPAAAVENVGTPSTLTTAAPTEANRAEQEHAPDPSPSQADAPEWKTCTRNKPWWTKGYDDVDTEGNIMQHSFRRSSPGTGKDQKFIAVTDRTEANALLRLYVKEELSRSLGIIKGHSSSYALCLKSIKHARDLTDRSPKERQQWFEDIEANAPDLGRVMRRCIGAYGNNRSTRSRTMLEHYSLTGDPDPKSAAQLRQRSGHKHRKTAPKATTQQEPTL